MYFKVITMLLLKINKSQLLSHRQFIFFCTTYNFHLHLLLKLFQCSLKLCFCKANILLFYYFKVKNNSINNKNKARIKNKRISNIKSLLTLLFYITIIRGESSRELCCCWVNKNTTATIRTATTITATSFWLHPVEY